MSTFIGNIEAKVDAKGRIFVPAAYRRLLPEEFAARIVLRKDAENNCYILYPEPVWNKKVDELKSTLDEWDPVDQMLLMQFISDAEWLEIDSQGRVLINKRHLQELNVNSDILFVGMMDRFAIWNKNDFEASRLSTTEFAKLLRERMTKK